MKLTLFLSLLTLLTHSAFSSELDLEAKLSALKLERLQALVMIDKLESSGRLSDDQADVARRDIASAHEENTEKLKSEALEKIKTKQSLSSF